jgi:hypothetical protein
VWWQPDRDPALTARIAAAIGSDHRLFQLISPNSTCPLYARQPNQLGSGGPFRVNRVISAKVRPAAGNSAADFAGSSSILLTKNALHVGQSLLAGTLVTGAVGVTSPRHARLDCLYTLWRYLTKLRFRGCDRVRRWLTIFTILPPQVPSAL